MVVLTLVIMLGLWGSLLGYAMYKGKKQERLHQAHINMENHCATEGDWRLLMEERDRI